MDATHERRSVRRNARLIVTAGEPAGIGPELCLSLAHEDLPCSIVVVSDPAMLRARAEQTGIATNIIEIGVADIADAHALKGELLVISQPFPGAVECGQLNTANAAALLDGLRLAVRTCLVRRNVHVQRIPTHPRQS